MARSTSPRAGGQAVARRRNHRWLPGAEALQEAAARSGFRKLRLDDAGRTVSLALPGMSLDVGGIGKGYAASEALERITALGIRSALVAMSGDLAFSGAPPGQRGWRVRIHDGQPEVPDVPASRADRCRGPTSGNTEQHVDIGGRRYSHIIDSASRMGLVDDSRSPSSRHTASTPTASIPQSASSAPSAAWH